MTITHRPGWMGTSHRSTTQQQPSPQPGSAPQQTPRQPESAQKPDRRPPGYNPYDTVTTRASDIWRFKPKRA